MSHQLEQQTRLISILQADLAEAQKVIARHKQAQEAAEAKLIIALADIQKTVDAAVLDTIWKCIKAQCPECARGLKPGPDGTHGALVRKSFCLAGEIHKLLPAQAVAGSPNVAKVMAATGESETVCAGVLGQKNGNVDEAIKAITRAKVAGQY